MNTYFLAYRTGGKLATESENKQKESESREMDFILDSSAT